MRFAQLQRRKTQPHCEVHPIRILAFDQVDLPLPVPSLELLFAQDRPLHVAKLLEANQHVHAIIGGEAGQRFAAMLPQPRKQIGCHADVERAVSLAGEDIDAWAAFGSHALCLRRNGS